MNSAKIEHWIACLGKTHQQLLSENVISSSELIALFPDIDELYCEPAEGIEMQFWAKTERFEKLHITLIKSTPSCIQYTGELPAPYLLTMTQSYVRELLGQPTYTSGPIKMPAPVGQTGGWESYDIDHALYPNIKVVFKYHQSMLVRGITFTLIEKDHDYP